MFFMNWYEEMPDLPSNNDEVKHLENELDEIKREFEYLGEEKAELEEDVKFWKAAAKGFELDVKQFADSVDEWRETALRYESILKQHGIDYE